MSIFIPHSDPSIFANHHPKDLEPGENYEMDICVDEEDLDLDSNMSSPNEREFQANPTLLDDQLSKMTDNLREVPKPSVSYRTELKRPDLKGMFSNKELKLLGTFRCSICQKVFCHSSSLSRHRMQAHFKSYTCTLCRKEITSESFFEFKTKI